MGTIGIEPNGNGDEDRFVALDAVENKSG